MYISLHLLVVKLFKQRKLDLPTILILMVEIIVLSYCNLKKFMVLNKELETIGLKELLVNIEILIRVVLLNPKNPAIQIQDLNNREGYIPRAIQTISSNKFKN